MTTEIQNGFLILVHLSDIELYYSSTEKINRDFIVISDEEFHHASDVMRHTIGDLIYVTDGEGYIYKCRINNISKTSLTVEIQSKEHFENNNFNLHFCLPYLKNPDRMKFAIEKSVELGITSFIIFSSKRTVSKSANLNRLQKIALSAMKQSLRAYLPAIREMKFEEIINMPAKKILLDQKAGEKFSFTNDHKKVYYFLFGPEGGFDGEEIKVINPHSVYRLGEHRLRSETAIVQCASFINSG